MSSYINAPATKMLASHCAVCARPLCDSVSVECGIGPDCRKKYAYMSVDVDEAGRAEANAIVHFIAVSQSGDEVEKAVTKLHGLGFDVLAARICKRLAKIQIGEKDGLLLLRTPYSEKAVTALRAIPGRSWDKKEKVNTFPATMVVRSAVMNALSKCFPGAFAIGAKGPFVVPAAEG